MQGERERMGGRLLLKGRKINKRDLKSRKTKRGNKTRGRGTGQKTRPKLRENRKRKPRVRQRGKRYPGLFIEAK